MLEFGDITFEAAPSIGGRITSARVGATELLVGPAIEPVNYGSTFWPSPQANWGWPPRRLWSEGGPFDAWISY